MLIEKYECRKEEQEHHILLHSKNLFDCPLDDENIELKKKHLSSVASFPTASNAQMFSHRDCFPTNTTSLARVETLTWLCWNMKPNYTYQFQSDVQSDKRIGFRYLVILQFITVLVCLPYLIQETTWKLTLHSLTLRLLLKVGTLLMFAILYNPIEVESYNCATAQKEKKSEP